MAEAIGRVFGEASTEGFSFILYPQKVRSLRNLFVVVESKDSEGKTYRVVGKVVDILTDNPLLSPENLKFFVSDEYGKEVADYLRSDRFKTYIARCEVIGEFDEEAGEIRTLTRPVETGAPVFFIDKDLLENLYFIPEPFNLFPGFTEQVRDARFSLDGDQLVTMHVGIFGMTGMGKTTTTGVLLEEFTVRGVKSVIFDPHGDYVNLGILKKDLFSALKEDLKRVGSPLRRLVKDYQLFLKERWSNYLNSVPQPYSDIVREEMKLELHPSSICFRLAMISSVLKRDVVLPFKERRDETLREFIKKLLKFSEEFDFKKLAKAVPPQILDRLIKLKIEGYPSIILNRFFNKYFVMNMIEAYSGEEISEAQEGIYTKWLDDMEKEIESSGEERRDLELVETLLSKVESLRDSNKSKYPVKRQLEKAKMVLSSQDRFLSVDSYELVKAFSGKSGFLSFVSNIIFDLSSLSPETVQRALLYSVFYSAFHLHKSGELSVQKGDWPILFVIEEARVLIPRSGAEDIDHPASRFARNIVRRVATEGRKMGLGLIIVSQKPASVDPLPVSQCNTLILHRVINPEDLSFVRTVGESISQEDIETLKTVERGVSIITGTALKTRRSLLVRFRDRLSKEGREHPRPLRRLWSEA